MKNLLLTLHTRTPLHLGCGTSVDVIDLPLMRERITHFPVLPGSSLKGVLRDRARQLLPDDFRALFGNENSDKKEDGKADSYAGCVQIMEAKLLAFPVRSLAGCFAWLTCPLALDRFQRDTGKSFAFPKPEQDKVVAGSDLLIKDQVVFEEYALGTQQGDLKPVVEALTPLVADKFWKDNLGKRLAIVHDDNFQHFVTTCTEVVARIAIDSETRTVKKGGLFNQENLPCESVFYTVLATTPVRRQGQNGFDPSAKLGELFKDNPILQIGGDETTGHGLCSTFTEILP